MDSIFSNPYLIHWLAMGGLVLLVAFFAMSETSLFSLSPLDRLRLKEQQPARGGVVEDLLSRPRRLLVTVLIGVETSSIVFSVLATSMVLSLWGPHGEWLVLLVIAPTFQFLGEIIPKSLALAYPARFAGRMAPLIKPVIFILSPFRVVFLQISRGILVALGFRPELPVHSVQQEDFVGMVEDSHRGGLIAAIERDFIQNLLNFGELRVGQIMVPRPDMFTLPVDLPFPEMIQAIKRSRFSRVPIYEETHDQVLGVLHAKDILELCHQGPCEGEMPRHLLRPAHYVPENKRAFDLLNELQAQHQRLALVVDEYGSLVGLVSVEDLLEELCGEIPQEFQDEEEALQTVSPGVWRVKGHVSLTDFNEELGLKLPAAEFDTIGGLVLNLFGSLPREGRTIAYDAYGAYDAHGKFTFRVLRMKGNRILEVEVRRETP
ncbi:MAG: hemolysin family protein [Deltaproteobacteria bacterium]|nr:hemolysin family protein [Deltaproteobacteria bacterium]